MPIGRLVSGKHPVTVRVTHDDYELLRRHAYDRDVTVNELIVAYAVERAREMAEDELRS